MAMPRHARDTGIAFIKTETDGRAPGTQRPTASVLSAMTKLNASKIGETLIIRQLLFVKEFTMRSRAKFQHQSAFGSLTFDIPAISSRVEACAQRTKQGGQIFRVINQRIISTSDDIKPEWLSPCHRHHRNFAFGGEKGFELLFKCRVRSA